MDDDEVVKAEEVEKKWGEPEEQGGGRWCPRTRWCRRRLQVVGEHSGRSNVK